MNTLILKLTHQARILKWLVCIFAGCWMAGRFGMPALIELRAQEPEPIPDAEAVATEENGIDVEPEETVTAVLPEPLHATARTGNLYFESAWQPREGLRLQLTPTGRQAAYSTPLVLHLEREAPRLMQHGAAKRTSGVAPARWRPERLPEQPRENVEWLLKLRDDGWLLYCDDQWVAWFPAPFTGPLTVAGRTGRNAEPVTFENAFFQRIEPWQFSDDFMIPETDEDAGLGEWMPVSGEWHIHTVREGAGSPERGSRTLLPEFSPNFYSLKGMGTNAVITSGHDFYDCYRFDAAVEAQPGEMGLVFYHSDISQEYYAFTVTLPAADAESALLALWHTTDGDSDSRRYLAAARLPDLFPNQWMRLEIETRHDRIIARMDGHTIFDIGHALPGGGSFGFFADADEEIIFDDVSAAPVPDLDLRDPERIRFHQVAVAGDFFPAPSAPSDGWWRSILRSPEPDKLDRLRPTVSVDDQWLAVGSPNHGGQVLSAEFQPENDTFHAGWIAGLRGSANGGLPSAIDPHLRFSAQRTGNTMVYRLFKVETPTRMTLLEQFRRPALTAPDEPLSLMLDMSEGHRLRLYCNGQLVLLHETDGAPIGAAGPFVAAGSSVSIRNFQYGFQRNDFWTTSQEKNPVFLADPFMRHWSSPEGEWITDDEGLTWHKSDFFGRYSLTLPVISNANVHIGILDGQTNGALSVVLRNGIASLYSNGGGDDDDSTRLLSAELYPRLREANTNQALFGLHVEDHWLYITADDYTVLRHTLQAPLQGTRIRVDGFSVDDLAHSDVIRHQVQDHLFTEAPSDWQLNGGDWRVVNRFQCDPRWSHMNAESRDGLAAAWTKQVFKGDFSIEMYAGMRHGWYHRCGDMNLTVMSPDGTPSQGYTVTCTGWDPDHSQLDSVFYRNGIEIDRSDAYMAPRRRAGNTRAHHEEVIRAGRDVHGAWYYIKLRRIGNRLEYYFDNELIFTQEDDEPLEPGRVGIWTFMNSIMIARVSISARERAMAPLDFEPLRVAGLVRPRLRDADPDPDPDLDPDLDPVSPPEGEAGATASDWLPPPEMMPSAWAAEDPVGHARINWHEDAFYGPYFTLTTSLGGGPMFARGQIPLQRYRDLAGWRFFLKRTERANLNAYFSIGRLDGNGDYQPAQQFFHRISGTDFDLGTWRKRGTTEVKATPSAGSPHWHLNGRWNPVTIWLPIDGLPAQPDDDNLWVRFEGLGVQQPSFEMQGLFGNGPGEAYAVARFASILTAMPEEFTENTEPLTNTVNGTAYQLYAGPSRHRILAQGDRETLVDAIRRHAIPTGINRFWIDTLDAQPGYPRELNWLIPESELELIAEWDPEWPDTVVLRNGTDWPSRHLAQAEIQVNDQPLELHPAYPNRQRVILPPGIAADQDKTGASVTLTVKALNGLSQTLEIETLDASRQAVGPVLTELKGITPIFENFATLDFGSILQADPNRMSIGRDNATRGAYLEIANRALNQRLQAVFNGPVCLASYPLIQFNYRGDRMSMLSLAMHNNWVARLNEPHPSAAEVRFASPFINDGQWRQWSGMISEVVSLPVFNHKMYTIPNIRLGSFHRIDQSGALSRWALSDFVIGPAVSQAEQLTFTAVFESLLPVESVMMALHPGLDAIRYWDREQLESLNWQPIVNAESAMPDIQDLADGPAQLVLRAFDSQGTPSVPVTVPFLLDRNAPQVQHALESQPHPLGNGTQLRLDFDTGDGSPIFLETLRVSLNDHPPVTIDTFLNSTSLRSPGLRVQLNWPYLLRAAIQKHPSGEPAVMRISGLRDGAGNPASEIEIPLAIPADDDNTGPSLLPAKYSDAVLFNTAWEGRLNQPVHFSSARNNATTVEHAVGEEPYLKTLTHGNSGNIALAFSRPVWKPNDHPYLAFRIRQPELRQENPAHINLVITLDNDQTTTVSLTDPPADESALKLDTPIAWASNQWHSVILNIPALLQQGDIEEIEARTVKSIAFDRRRTTNQMQMDLQSLFVFRPWQTNDTITIDAYDQSGIDGVVWTFYGNEDTVLSDALDPREVPAGTAGWLAVRVRDRAGNLSVPLRIPMLISGEEAKSFAEHINQRLQLAQLIK